MKSTPDHKVTEGRVGAFWDLAPFDGGSSWVGKWVGQSPWERHSKGDEFLHVLKGQVEVEVLLSSGKQSNLVSAGSIFVVPRNHWHRQIARQEVVVVGATPGITDHSESEPIL